MARRATRDTYGIERVGGVDVRRKIMAGDPVPDHIQVDGKTEEFTPDRPGYKEGDVTLRVRASGNQVEYVGEQRQSRRASQAADQPATEGNIEFDARDEADAALARKGSKG